MFRSFFAYEKTLVKSTDAASSVYCPPDSAAVNGVRTVGRQVCVKNSSSIHSVRKDLLHLYDMQTMLFIVFVRG